LIESSIIVLAGKTEQKLYRAFSIEGEKIKIYSCKEAFNLVEEFQATVIIIDCGYEIGLGLKLLKNIKKAHPNTPVIMLTDKSSEDTVIQAFRLGARDYLKKTIDIFDLQNRIRDLLKINRNSREKRTRYYPNQNAALGNLSSIVNTDKPMSILAVIKNMEENLSDKIDLENCAKQANMSKYYFCRYFKENIGMTPMKFLKHMRINKSKKLLLNKNISSTEVGFAVGFNDYSTFSRNFKILIGMSPNKYRKTYRSK